MAPTSAEARMGAHKSWARTADRSARTAPARAAMQARFEREVDPDGTLDPRERAIRAEHARKAFYSGMAAKAVRARRLAAGARVGSEAPGGRGGQSGGTPESDVA